VPHVQRVQSILYELIDVDREVHADGEDDEQREPDRRGFRLRRG
jgi:hypothetical protein